MGFNSTIISKKKTCKSCGKSVFIFSKGRCADCSRIEDAQKRMEKENERIIQEENLSDLIADADRIFSKYIRLKYSDKDGWLKCYTCDCIMHWTMFHNGHYISRSHLYLRFDERNCRPQEENCNCRLHGNIPEFTKQLELENPGITDILKQESLLVYKPTREEIKQIIVEYSLKLKQLKK